MRCDGVAEMVSEVSPFQDWYIRLTFQFSLTPSKLADSFGNCFRISSPMKMF